MGNAIHMSLSQVKAWVRWRDQRAVDACRGSPDEIPSALRMYPPWPPVSEEQSGPTIDDAVQGARITAFRLVGDEMKRVDVAYWLHHSVNDEKGLIFERQIVVELWPPPDGSSPEPSPGRGRRKGAGSFEEVDRPLVEEMRQRITSGEATSVYGAARFVLSRAHGNGSDDAKRKRLVDRYRTFYGKG